MAIDVPLTAQPPVLAGAPALPQSAVPTNQRLGKNPMLPQHPLGAYTDAQYEAQQAELQAEISKRYADILQQLGYTDDQGNFIMGSAEVNAGRTRNDLEHQMGLARDEVTKQAQQQGTLFSGIRGTLQARAEYPMANAEARLASDLPVQLQQLYEQAGGLVSEYTLRQNHLLADAAARRAPDVTKPPPTPSDFGSTGLATDPNSRDAAGNILPAGTVGGQDIINFANGPHPAGVGPTPVPGAWNDPYGGVANITQPAAPTPPPTPAPTPAALPGGMASPNNPGQTYPAAPSPVRSLAAAPPQPDPHTALMDIHKSSLAALNKLRDQRLGF